MKTALTLMMYLLGITATLHLSTISAYPDIFVEKAKLMAADDEAEDTLGGKVALSGDTAVVEVIRDDNKSGY